MGSIYVKNGIRIYIFSRDHNPPHIHAFYAEYEALINIMSLEVIKGSLPKRQLKMVQEWCSDSDVKSKLVEQFYKLNPELRRG